MKEHHHRRHKRSCSPEDDPILTSSGKRQKVSQRELIQLGDERESENIKRVRHHHSHKKHHSHKERGHADDDGRPRSSGHHRYDGHSDREHKERRLGNLKESQKAPEDYPARIKEERLDSEERVQPSSSKWDDDDDRSNKTKVSKGRDVRPGMDLNGTGSGRVRKDREDRFKQGPRKKPFFKREEEDTSGMEWGKRQDSEDKKKNPPVEKEKPNFGLSGKLTEDSNTYKGVVIKYSEPPEARIPNRRWRLYPFKGDESLKVLYIHRASAFLLGRDRKVVDIPLDHPSCSKQHAALQYRLVPYTRNDGSSGKRIRPYIIDLESANGTFVNNNKIETKKYVELIERDVLKFGFSSREYVLLHEHSKGDEDDDNL